MSSDEPADVDEHRQAKQAGQASDEAGGRSTAAASTDESGSAGTPAPATGAHPVAAAAPPVDAALRGAGAHPGAGAAPTSSAAPSSAPSLPVIPDVPIGRVPVEIGLRSLDGTNHFRIQLTPDDLGRVEVRLDIASDGEVRAHLLVDRPETLSLLNRDRPHLERALEQAGLRTGDDSVAFSLRDGPSTGPGGQGAGRESAFDERPRGQPGRAPAFEDTTAAPRAQPAPSAPRPTGSRAAGIDVRI